MPDSTPILQLPYILPSQAQKHVTHNEAIRLLDVIVQLSVTARNLAAPPATPAQGDRYIVASGATGLWSGQVGRIALFENGAWQFFVPNEGWTAWVVSEQVLASFAGGAWVTQADGPLTVTQLGVSATADATNRLSVSAPATLLNHAGAGHQLKINKAISSDTASLLFQTGFSGRAEMGTAGGDDFAIKVSADGTSFVTGLSISSASGAVSLPVAAILGGQPSDPIAPANGTIWLNSTTGQVKVQSGGEAVVIAIGGAPLLDGGKGDITVSATGTVWQIDAFAVSNAKLAPMSPATFKARASAGAGAPEDISATSAAQLLPVFAPAAKGLVPASGGGTTNYLRADGTWAAPSGVVATLADLGVTATAAEVNALDGVTSVGTTLIRAASAAAQRTAMGVDTGGQVLHVQDAKASNAGGNFTAGIYAARELQTVVKNTISGASLALNQITLPAGTYFVMAEAQAYQVGGHAIRLRKVNGTNVNLVHGTVQYNAPSPTSVGTSSQLIGEFTITETSAIELQHRCEVTRATIGRGVGLTGLDVNVFANVFIKRIA